MKKYIVQLKGYYDVDTSETIEAESKSKAKGIYIKRHLSSFFDAGYPKSLFFRAISISAV